MTPAPRDRLCLLVNLLIPGGGLILAGDAFAGVVFCLLLTVVANLSLAGWLLIPDEVPPPWRITALIVAAGTYILAQLRCAHRLRWEHQQREALRRREVLAAVQRLLDEGRADRAWEVLEPLAGLAERDLLVAWRVAQVLTAKRDVEAALAAWQRLRRLDRHRLYRADREHGERLLRRWAAGAGEQAADQPEGAGFNSWPRR
jgi:hypothetical protein